MTLDKLFNDELFEDYEMQEKYKDAVALFNIFNTKSQEELVEDALQIWKTWESGKGKTEFCMRTGIDKTRMHNLLTNTTAYIKFEDYIRIMAVGKDYAVIEQKYPMTEEIQKALNRVKYNKKRKDSV